MNRKAKQIIAVILCITMVVGFDNVYGYRTIFKYLNNMIITNADVGENSDSSESKNDNPSDNKSENNKSEEIQTTDMDDTEKTGESGEFDDIKENDEDEAFVSDNINDTSGNSEYECQQIPIADVNSEIVGNGQVLNGDVELESGKNTKVQVSKAENFVKDGIYYIQSQTDWTKLAEISMTSRLEDMTFIIYRRESKYDDWNLSNVKIGNKDYPFSGIIYQLYTSSVINTNVVLFDYLSSKAQIGKKEGDKNYSITFNYTSTVNAGLATHLVLDKGSNVYMGDSDDSNYYVKIKGTINDKNKVVGGLFSYIEVDENSMVKEGSDETCNIYINNNGNIDLSAINGTITGAGAGGYVGNITGKINVVVNNIQKITAGVINCSKKDEEAAGGFIGYAGPGVKITFENEKDINLEGNVEYYNTETGYTQGGLIGYIENAELYLNGKGDIIQNANVSALKYAGGLIGCAENSTVVVKNYTQSTNTYIYQYMKGLTSSNYAVGGIIGKYFCDENNSDKRLEISYIKSENKTAETDSKIRISSANNTNNKRGGLAGIIDAGPAKVYIHDINTDAKETGAGGENCYYVSLVKHSNNDTQYMSQTETGGLTGLLAGTDIKIENIIFNYVYIKGTNGINSNSIGGSVVGNIAARTGYIDNQDRDTKIIIKDIDVMSNYIEYVNTYHGGLFGCVSNSAIAMQGEINLKNVPYKTYANSAKFANDTVMLATNGNRGFVAAYADKSFIYRDMNCDYTLPITYNDDGTIVEFDADVNTYTHTGSANTNSNYLYCIDEIGNSGSVFKNVDNILKIDNDYDNIVTGKVTRDDDGYYKIDSMSDALRLAIAGNTVCNGDGKPKFGGNCFAGEGEEIPLLTDILADKFHITADLDLKEAGIHGFVNNNNIKYPFTGIFEGVKTDGKNPVVTLEFISYQRYGGLFTHAKNATFNNLDIKGCIHYLVGDNTDYVNGSYQVSAAAGSLAAYASESISIDNVNIYTSIKERMTEYSEWNNNMHMYGGMFGMYEPLVKDATYTCIDSIISPKFTVVRSNAMSAGMIGWMKTNSSSVMKNMTIENCTIGTKIITNKIYGFTTWNNNIHGRISGLISLISNDRRNVGDTGNLANDGASIGNFTYATINMKNIIIDGLNIDTSVSSNPNVRVTGGALGYTWTYADVTIDGLTVKNSSILSRGVTGGLISVMNGSVDLKNIKLESLKMIDKGTDSTYCSFLIGNGQNAITTIENYEIAADGSVSEDGYSSFDEIVGLTVKIADKANNYEEKKYLPGVDVEYSYSTGGIVNIIDSEFNSFTDDTSAYKSYVNRVVTTQNKYTRYYYNLFTGDSAEWTISNGVIDSEKKFMTFTVARYAKSTFDRFIKKYFTGGSIPSKYTIDSDLDLNGYSYYPAPVSGLTIDFNNHKVKLYGEEIDSLENGLAANNINTLFRSNKDTDSQHYMMHAGLFNSTNEFNVSNLVLTGTIANLGDKTGAIASICSYGNLNVNNIIFDNLKVADYEGTGAGLAFAHIGTDAYDIGKSTSVKINNIITTGYDESEPVAAALIGYVGNDEATNVKVSFSNMKVEDEKLSDNVTGKVFKYASYIYDYRFTQELAYNRCFISYLFTKEECDNDNVTFGKEIKDGVHYSDMDRTDGDKLDIAIKDAIDSKYIPYIYMERNIYVNPRNGDITEGCGTYEDPYIISNSKQLLTLYLYLTGKTEYESVFRGAGTTDDAAGVWKVVKVGGNSNNSNECSVVNGEEIKHSAVNYGSEGFPTRDDLRTAYYKISADINLGTINDMNDKNIAGEYCGLGCEEYPFAGVIIGTKDNGTGNYKITLPKQGTKNVTNNGSTYEVQLTQSAFGLIQYMQGAVIKDLDIENSGHSENAYYNVTECGGGVAAIVSGGDNIIDNVNVRVNFNICIEQEDGSLYDIKGIGGYVGVVENGSVIFRNTEKNDNREAVSLCHFEDYSKVTNTQLLINSIMQVTTDTINKLFRESGIDVYVEHTNYLRASASYNPGTSYSGEYGEIAGLYVGMVYDGYVLYEGYSDRNNNSYTLEKTDMGLGKVYADTYPLVNGFHMINGNILDENTNGSSEDKKKITFKVDDTGKMYTVNIFNENALEILTLALNSDSLSVYYCEHNDHSTAYGYKSRCRKASYDDVGSSDAINSADMSFAKKYDDNKTDDKGYLYPYICYKYFDYTNMLTADGIDYDNTDYAGKNYEAYKKTLSEITVTEKVNNQNVYKDFDCIVSNVNKTDAKVADYETTYELMKNSDDTPKTYDLSKYDLSFKGIGGIYTYDYSDFRANFDGNDNIIKFYISRAYDDEVMYSGMFNTLIYSQKILSENVSEDQLEIGNFTIKNSIVYNPNKFSKNYNIGTIESLNSYGLVTCSTGGVTGVIQGAWKLNNITWERDEAINDDIIEYDVSGYMNVGGFIGRINNSLQNSNYIGQEWLGANESKMNDIDIINCNLKGTGTYHIGITELGSTNSSTSWGGYRYVAAGGIVGAVGTNHFTSIAQLCYGNVDINACDIDYADVLLRNKGYAAGVVGQVATRHNQSASNSASFAPVGNITVNGKDSDGNISHINNITVRSENESDAYSLGGMLGHIEAPRSKKVFGGSIYVSNYEMSDICIDDKRTELTKEYQYYEGSGGVIGYARANYIDISNIEIKGSNNIGTEYTRKNIGGIIGRLYNVSNTDKNNAPEYMEDNEVNIKGCNLSGMNIKAYCTAGGFIGYTLIEKVNIGSNNTKDVIKNSTIKVISGDCAGGIVGMIEAENNTRFNSWPSPAFTNIDVINTEVLNESGKYAGGVLGNIYNQINAETELKFKNINVYSENAEPTIQAIECAGGILGMTGQNNKLYAYVKVNLEGYIGVGQKYNSDTAAWDSDTNTGINIRAAYSGGIIGREYVRTAEKHPADIFVANNRIYSIRNTADSETYSGGLYGEFYPAANTDVTFNSVNVKNNIIYTGRNTVEINNTYKWQGGNAAGGIVGNMYSEPNTNVYLPNVTLENNSIGYYAVTYNERNNNWKNVTLDSRDIKLLEVTSYKDRYGTVSWDEIENLDDNNIANYSVAFGQFIGKHSNYETGQVYILSPKVKVDKDKTGSIPVIDVGMDKSATNIAQSTVTYHDGDPYKYRKVCHIVYVDDVTGSSYADISNDASAMGRYPAYISDELLISGKVNYNFGLLEEIVNEYRNLNDNVTDIKDKNYNYITGKRLNMYMTYNDNSKYSLCGKDNNYFDVTYNIFEDGKKANILNGVPVLVIDGLQPQTVGDYAAAILTNGGGVISDTFIEKLNGPNSSYANAQPINKFWQIECKNAYIDTDGSIHIIEDTDTRFDEHSSSSILCKNYNRLNLANSVYDQYIDAGNGNKIYTITLLCYKYICPAATSDGGTVNKEEVIYIPVFVKEKVTVDSYIRVLSDEEYSFNNAASIGYKDEVTVSHDSVYTIYSEFVYDGIRNNKAFKNDKLHKFISTSNESDVETFTTGTRMTLIDYQTGVAYYYTVDDNPEYKNKIPFEAFKDKDGNKYVQRNISNEISDELSFNSYTSIGYKDGTMSSPGTETYIDTTGNNGIGVERYFIIVEPAETENNVHFTLKISTEAKDLNGIAVDEFFNKDTKGDAAGMDMTCIPGPVVRFGGVDANGTGTEGITYVTGKISADEKVKINSNIEVILSDYDSAAPSPYWEKKFVSNTIDSANTDKYLDISVTLLDTDGKVVAWPAGTNISINGESKTVLENNLIIYEYKDSKLEFPMNTIKKDILGKCYYYNVDESDTSENMNWIYYDDDKDKYYYYTDYDAIEHEWIKKYLPDKPQDKYISLSNQMDITLDFQAADLDEYNGKNYTVMLKLYRSDDSTYLSEESTKTYGKSIRQYSNSIFGESVKDLSVALTVEDILSLGINLYNNIKDKYDILFTNKFDFSSVINKNRADSDVKEWSDKNYMATYRIYKKVDKSDATSTVKDIGYNDNIGNTIESAGSSEYQIISFEDSPFELYDDAGNKLDTENITVNGNEKQNVVITTKNFSENEIKNGINGVKYVTEWNMNLKVKAENIKDTDLTNYKITVTYVPYDKDSKRPENDEEQKWFDFFVFTVAKLKTDM